MIKPCGRMDTRSRGGVWVEARQPRSSENVRQLQGLDSVTGSGSSPGLSSLPCLHTIPRCPRRSWPCTWQCGSLVVLSWTLLPFPDVGLGILTSQLLAALSASPGHRSPTVSMFCLLSLGLFTWVHSANHLLRPAKISHWSSLSFFSPYFPFIYNLVSYNETEFSNYKLFLLSFPFPSPVY